ncbi:C40 family peptidase [Actinacidiphila yanglinensis]|uniref:C40 family peptidase n=1 Tax=Actinacidiphila yanglinensis TaxID=310779 RepID=UPI001F27CF8B|nr:C40 family peptidase [Actinacidiphila yanglinensis]
MSDTHTHSRRRRHAAPRHPNWVRRAGLVGGVVSAFALCGAAAPAIAETTHPTTTGGTPSAAGSSQARSAGARTATLSTAASAQQAVVAVQREALAAALSADQEQAAKDAARTAAKAHKAARHKAEAAAKAAKARAAQAAAPSAGSSTSGSSGQSSSSTATATPAAEVTAASSSKVDQLIAFLKSQLGKPYVYGATGPDSYDCSGLTQAAFASIGVSIPRTSQEQSTAGTPVSVSALQPGDLIFWGGEGSAYHVGVFIGDGQYLDAANPSTPVAIHQLADYMPDWAVNVL